LGSRRAYSNPFHDLTSFASMFSSSCEDIR
jgi:hypothetical protein